MDRPVAGTFTFLFTGVEGPTSVPERRPDEMAAAIARHDVLVAEAVATHRGTLVKQRQQGDSAFAVFAAASDALRAAADLQRAIAAEAGPLAVDIRVRAAVHTGEAEVRDADYSGPALNRTARILALAHGEQVLVSGATAVVIGERPPAGTTLRDLGEHQLRDLTSTERVYQLVADGLREDFPPLRSLETFRHNLPVQRTSFVGREEELEDLRTLLASTRLVTLVGVGGTGKTRLALQAAAGVMDRFPDGVFLCDLAPLRDQAVVPRAIAAAIGVLDPLAEASGSADVATAMRAHVAGSLQRANALILLDNCEHLLDAAVASADVVLEACPMVRVLATSREPLGVTGEHVRRVPPLGAPRSWDSSQPASVLLESEAVQLFCDRAREVRSGFELDDRNATAVAQICHRVEGIPLAIELAAARLNALSPQQIADRLDDAFSLLTSGGRTALERHQTLRAAMEWSYELLSEDAAALLRRLAVFVGGWTLEAAERVGGAPPLEPASVLDLLGQLVDKSFVTAEETGDTIRYRLLEPIRQFVEAQLRESGEEAQVRTAHRDHFLDFSEGASFVVQVRYDRLGEVVVELENLWAAMRWSVESADAVPALRLASNTYGVFRQVGRRSEAEDWLRTALSTVDDRPSTLVATVLGQLASVLEDAGDLAAANESYERAVAMMRAKENDFGRGFVLIGQARIHYFHARYDQMYAAYDEAYRLMSPTGLALSLVLFNWAWMAFAAGRIEDALRFARETIEVAQPDEREPIAGAQTLLGVHAAMSGDLEGGRHECAAGLEVAESANRIIVQWLSMVVGAFEAGRPDGDATARRHFLRALELARGQTLIVPIPWTLEFVAQVAAGRGDIPEAANLFGAARRYLDRFGVVARWEPFEDAVEDARRRVSEALGPRYESELRAGSMLTLSQAVDLAIRVLEDEEPAGDVAADEAPSFRCEGDVRTITYASRTVRLRETKGLTYLAQLLANPGRELHVLELVSLVEGHGSATKGATNGPSHLGHGDAGELLDAEAKQAYRRRLDDLRAELEEARAWNDPVRAEKAEAEIESLTAELSRSVGLGGRDVRAASAAERARSAVTKAIRTALGRIADEHPGLGAHLTGTVKTGIFCSYAPDPRVPITWSF